MTVSTSLVIFAIVAILIVAVIAFVLGWVYGCRWTVTHPKQVAAILTEQPKQRRSR